MHHQGAPETMQDDPRYDDRSCSRSIDWLEARIPAAEAAGIARERIIVDPGFGFGKNVQHNLALMNALALLHGLGCPIMLGRAASARSARSLMRRRRTSGSPARSRSR